MRQLILKILPLACLALAPHATSADWRMERFESRHAASGIESFRITNLHGDVRVRTTGEELIEVTAVIQRGEAVPTPEIRVDDESQPATIDVAVGRPPDETDVLQRVDLTVSLPARIALIVQTDDGLIELKGRAAAVEAQSIRGRVYVSTGAEVDVYTTHGSVEIVYESTPAGSIETQTGDIMCWLPERSSAKVRVRTQSSITTDYSVSIDLDDDGFRNGLARLGGGRSSLELRSTRGSVHLLRPGR